MSTSDPSAALGTSPAVFGRLFNLDPRRRATSVARSASGTVNDGFLRPRPPRPCLVSSSDRSATPCILLLDVISKFSIEDVPKYRTSTCIVSDAFCVLSPGIPSLVLLYSYSTSIDSAVPKLNVEIVRIDPIFRYIGTVSYRY